MSIRKRVLPRSGEVRWQHDYKDRDGKRRAKQFATRAAAVAHETRVRAELVAGTHVADGASVTIREAAAAWLAACETRGLEAQTLCGYRDHVRLHIEPLIGDLKLNRLTAPAAQQFIDRLAANRNRPTVKKVVTSLKAIVAEAVRRGLAANNPLREVRLSASPREEEPAEFPAMDEVKTLLERGDALVHAALFTGMRASELRGLTWEHVDFKEAVIRVRQRADRFNKIGRPKSKAARRDIPMGPYLLSLLREWKLAQPKEQRSNGLVFPDTAGNVEDHTRVYRRFGALQLACGISKPRVDDDGKPVVDEEGKPQLVQKFGPHALRHACASLLIDQGWQAKRLQVFLGHASIGLTFDTYGHLFKDAEGDQKAMARLEMSLLR
jgi:integrase